MATRRPLKPLISVLLPVYNGWPYIREAVESIFAQTVYDFEFVIVDDGSTDETAEYLKGLTLRDGRVNLITMHQNNGLVCALNTGLMYCRGDYIARMDADDISLRHRFEAQLRYLSEHPEYDGCGAYIRYFGRLNQDVTVFPTDPILVRDQLFDFTTVPHPTYFFKRQIYQRFQYDPAYPHSEDSDFLFRVTEFYKISNVPKVLLHYRTHEDQVCRKHSHVQKDSRRRAEEAARKRRKEQEEK